MRREEDRLHIQIVVWLKAVVGCEYVHHSPNGGYRNIVTAKRLKEMGVSRGFPDIIIMDYSVPLAIEVKSKAGVVSKEQKGWMHLLESHGWRTYVAKDLWKFKEWFYSVVGSEAGMQ